MEVQLDHQTTANTGIPQATEPTETGTKVTGRPKRGATKKGPPIVAEKAKHVEKVKAVKAAKEVKAKGSGKVEAGEAFLNEERIEELKQILDRIKGHTNVELKDILLVWRGPRES